MPKNTVDAAIEMIKQRGKQLDRWQEESERRMAEQRRNLCVESDALIEQLKQAREWVNLSAVEVCSMNKPIAEYVAQMEKQIADGAKMLGAALDLNLDLQNKADMWRDEFERIKAICYGKSLEFLEIQGICERAMLDIRSKISLIDQREKVAEENIDLRRELRVISDHYDILRAEMVESHAKIMHGMFQAATTPKTMDYCRTMSNAKLRGKCLACDGTGSLANVGGAKDEDTGCPHCEGCGCVEIPDLSWLKNGKVQFNLLPKEHPDYDPT